MSGALGWRTAELAVEGETAGTMPDGYNDIVISRDRIFDAPSETDAVNR